MDYVNNIPKSLSYIREDMVVSLISSIRLIRYYVVNINDSSRVKLKYLKDLVVEISMIDYFIECLYHNRVLGKNRYLDYGKKLENIRKITYGVIGSEKK